MHNSFSDPDWPDVMDRETGTLTYFGDNKKPGGGLHQTGKRGNRVLRRIFEDAFAGLDGRLRVPPTFVFARGGTGRAVDFLGLAVPGVSDALEADDLVAIWKTSGGKRFQNYRARFAILDAGQISREWIDSLIAGNEITEAAPDAWIDWRNTGRRRRLIAERSTEWRTKEEQFPSSRSDISLLKTITDYFADRPHDFEHCAVEISRIMLPDIATGPVTL